MRLAADNTVGVLKELNEAVGVGGEGDILRCAVCGQDLIDAAAVEWSCEGAVFYFVLQVGGEVCFMLDDAAVHVYDV